MSDPIQETEPDTSDIPETNPGWWQRAHLSMPAHIDKLAAALAKAQGEMPNALFNRINPHFKNKYADLASLRDAVMPSLSKHGLSVVQMPTLHETHGFCLHTMLMHASGQYLELFYPLIRHDKPQQTGSDLTYARRHSLASLVGVASEEDDDGQAAASGAPIDTETAIALQDEIRENGIDEPQFLKYVAGLAKKDIPTVAAIPEELMPRVRSAIAQRKAKTKADPS